LDNRVENDSDEKVREFVQKKLAELESMAAQKPQITLPMLVFSVTSREVLIWGQ
jgi:hypothetical protein